MNWKDRLAGRVEELLRQRIRARQARQAAATAGTDPMSGQMQPPRPMSGPVLYYTETLIDHFANPRHVGEMAPDEADGYAVIGDPSCGDQMKLWIRVQDGRIADIRFRSFGCPGAIATSSMATELACGRTVEEALALTDDDVIAALGGIPENKRHCSLLGINALHAAIRDYLAKAAANALAAGERAPESR
jgi:nitrogen fixation NifU-like protein